MNAAPRSRWKLPRKTKKAHVVIGDRLVQQWADVRITPAYLRRYRRYRRWTARRQRWRDWLDALASTKRTIYEWDAAPRLPKTRKARR